MDYVRTAVVLAHPVAAVLVVWLFFRQRGWRGQSTLLRGEERVAAVSAHESMGDRIAIISIGIVALAFASNMARGVIDHGDATRFLVPGFHGITGIMGLSLMLYLWKLGRDTTAKKASGEPFSGTKERHGRISDLLGVLIIIHSFLGFMYMLSIL